MHIVTKPEVVNTLLDQLRDTFHGEPVTEGVMEKIQDTIEHALVSYTEKDIEERAFLNLHIKQEKDQVNLQLFILDVIYIDMPFRTNVPTGTFLCLDTIQDLCILQSDSL